MPNDSIPWAIWEIVRVVCACQGAEQGFLVCQAPPASPPQAAQASAPAAPAGIDFGALGALAQALGVGLSMPAPGAPQQSVYCSHISTHHTACFVILEGGLKVSQRPLSGPPACAMASCCEQQTSWCVMQGKACSQPAFPTAKAFLPSISSRSSRACSSLRGGRSTLSSLSRACHGVQEIIRAPQAHSSSSTSPSSCGRTRPQRPERRACSSRSSCLGPRACISSSSSSSGSLRPGRISSSRCR